METSTIMCVSAELDFQEMGVMQRRSVFSPFFATCFVFRSVRRRLGVVGGGSSVERSGIGKTALTATVGGPRGVFVWVTGRQQRGRFR